MGSEKFYDELNKFIDCGVMKKIYSTTLTDGIADEIVVCNVLNQFYAAYSKMLFDKTDYCGVIIGPTILSKLVDNPLNLYAYVDALSEKLLEKSMISLRDSYLKKLISAKDEYSAMGPGNLVDLEYEKQLIEKYGG